MTYTLKAYLKTVKIMYINLNHYWQLLLCLLMVLGMQAQENYSITDNHLLFEDAKTGEPVLVYNDTMLVRGFDFKTHEKTQFPEGLIRSEFNNYHYQINSTNYLVDNGCGPVIKFEHNRFTRIDNSFRHRNQYGAIPFSYNNKIYLWGGSGLFDNKNILTSYDFTYKEWFAQTQQSKRSIISRHDPMYLKNNSDLYMFCGWYDDINLENIEGATNYLWRLDLETFNWHKAAKYSINQNFIAKQSYNPNTKTFQKEDKFIVINNLITEIDLFNATIEIYKQTNSKSITNIIYHPNTQSVTYVHFSNDTYHILNEPYSVFRGKLVDKMPLYEPSITNTFVKITLALAMVLLVAWVLKRLLKRKQTNKRQLLYLKRKATFALKSNKPIPFNELQFEVLKVFLTHKNTFFTLNTLNDVLSSGLNPENHVTINKRRERVLKELAFELSNLLQLEKDTVFMTRSSELDKRIKEIKLNIDIVVK